MRRFGANLVLLAVTLAVFFLLAEAALRLLGVQPLWSAPDPTLGFRYRPHARYRWTSEGFSTGRMNAAGWRDRDHTLAKPPGVTRILFVGDSFVEAFQVPFDSTFHQRVERSLNASAPAGRRYEVIALGQSGSGTTQEYLTYERWGAAYDPDVVAVLFILNDPSDNWSVDAADAGRPYFRMSGDSIVLDTSFARSPAYRRRALRARIKAHSSLLTYAAHTLQQAAIRLHPNRSVAGLTGPAGWYYRWNFDRRAPADSLPAFQLTERVLARFARDVQRDGRRFVVFAAGASEQEDPTELAQNRADPSFDPDKTMRWLTAFGRREHVTVVPLTPAFRRAARSRRLWFGPPGLSGHWNTAGHAAAAAVMTEWLRRTLPPPPPAAASAR